MHKWPTIQKMMGVLMHFYLYRQPTILHWPFFQADECVKVLTDNNLLCHIKIELKVCKLFCSLCIISNKRKSVLTKGCFIQINLLRGLMKFGISRNQKWTVAVGYPDPGVAYQRVLKKELALEQVKENLKVFLHALAPDGWEQYLCIPLCLDEFTLCRWVALVYTAFKHKSIWKHSTLAVYWTSFCNNDVLLH